VSKTKIEEIIVKQIPEAKKVFVEGGKTEEEKKYRSELFDNTI